MTHPKFANPVDAPAMTLLAFPDVAAWARMKLIVTAIVGVVPDRTPPTVDAFLTPRIVRKWDPVPARLQR
jgi:hypothetical protein